MTESNGHTHEGATVMLQTAPETITVELRTEDVKALAWAIGQLQVPGRPHPEVRLMQERWNRALDTMEAALLTPA